MNKEPKSCWQKIDLLFLQYKAAFPNRIIRDKLYCMVYNAYSQEFIRAKRPDWSDNWRDEVYVRWYKKFEHVLDHPECVKKGNDGSFKLTAYMTASFLSTAADVYRHFSREEDIAKEAKNRSSQGKTLQQLKFEDLVWSKAEALPGKRGDVFRSYLMGLENRSAGKGLSKKYTLEGIASEQNLTSTGVATIIRRTKIALEHELRPLGVRMGVLSCHCCYR